MEAAAQGLTVSIAQSRLPPKWEAWGLATFLGGIVAAFGASRAYFPQCDAFSYYQIFHYLYSSLYLRHEIPLWEPYASYGIPSAFELAFSIGPSKALAAILGLLLHVSDIKLLYFLAVGLDYALLCLTAIFIVCELAPGSRIAMLYAGVVMGALHMSEWQPNFGYGFCLPIVLVILFVVRFFKTYNGIYISLCALTLVSCTFGSPQYFIIIEGYIGCLFALFCGYACRANISWQSVRHTLRTLVSPRSVAIAALAVGLALALWAIDRDALSSLAFVAPGRDPTTLKVPLDVYLGYAGSLPIFKVMDIFAGRPVNWDVMNYFSLTGFTLLIFTAFHCRNNRFVGPLLGTLAVVVLFALPNQFPVARFVYDFVPAMDHYRHVQFALMFAKPFVVLLAAIGLADICRQGLDNRRAGTLIRFGITLFACAAVYSIGAEVFGNFLNVVGLGTVAMDSAAAFAVAAGWAGLRPASMRSAVVLLAAIAVFEPVAHRVLLDRALVVQIEQLRGSSPKGPTVEDWYRYPRSLEYQATRRDVNLPFVPVIAGAILYHGLWSFVGVDPCVPMARSDTYGKQLGATLESSGIPPMELAWGLYGLPGGTIHEAFACGTPKLRYEGDPRAQILVTGFDANHLSLTVDASAPGLLTYSDAYHPGWKVTVDQIIKPVLQTDVGFKSVILGAGNHHVVWSFEPFMSGVALGAVGLALASVVPVLLLFAGLRCDSARRDVAPTSPGS